MAIGKPIRPDGHFAEMTFHDDHEPSFQVDLNRKTWRCWVCAIGRDAAELVKKVNKCDFPTAVKFLADLAGVASPSGERPGPRLPGWAAHPCWGPGLHRQQARQPAARQAVRPVLGEASTLVDEATACLWGPGGGTALDYLRGRGLTEASALPGLDSHPPS